MPKSSNEKASHCDKRLTWLNPTGCPKKLIKENPGKPVTSCFFKFNLGSRLPKKQNRKDEKQIRELVKKHEPSKIAEIINNSRRVRRVRPKHFFRQSKKSKELAKVAIFNLINKENIDPTKFEVPSNRRNNTNLLQNRFL